MTTTTTTDGCGFSAQHGTQDDCQFGYEENGRCFGCGHFRECINSQRAHVCTEDCQGEPYLTLILRSPASYGPIGIYRNECSGHDLILSDHDILTHYWACDLCTTGWALLNDAFPVVRNIDPDDLPFE